MFAQIGIKNIANDATAHRKISVEGGPRSLHSIRITKSSFYRGKVVAARVKQRRGKQWAQMSLHEGMQRRNGRVTGARAVSPVKSSRHPLLYIMREATLLSHSPRSCCSIGELNFIAIFFTDFPSRFDKRHSLQSSVSIGAKVKTRRITLRRSRSV